MSISKAYENAKVSKLYTNYRPTYPKELTDSIIRYCKDGGASFTTYVDLACGTGKSTEAFIGYFDKVIAIDQSESQLNEAREVLPQEVDIHVSSADDLTLLDDNSVDLITVAEAFHWFLDRQK